MTGLQLLDGVLVALAVLVSLATATPSRCSRQPP